MSFVEPFQGRAKIENDGLSLRVLIPARRSIFAIIFLGAWMVGWYFGEVSAIREIIAPSGSPSSAFLVAWLVGWTIGGAFAALTLLWSLFGQEVLELQADALVYRRSILGLGWRKVYSVAAIKDLRVTSPGLRFDSLTFSKFLDRKGREERPRPGDFWGLSGGPIVFDYGARTVRCGGGVDEAEGKTIVAQLMRWNHRLQPAGAA